MFVFASFWCKDCLLFKLTAQSCTSVCLSFEIWVLLKKKKKGRPFPCDFLKIEITVGSNTYPLPRELAPVKESGKGGGMYKWHTGTAASTHGETCECCLLASHFVRCLCKVDLWGKGSIISLVISSTWRELSTAKILLQCVGHISCGYPLSDNFSSNFSSYLIYVYTISSHQIHFITEHTSPRALGKQNKNEPIKGKLIQILK